MKNSFIFKILFFMLSILFVPNSVLAMEQTLINENTRSINLSKNAQFFLDKGNNFSFEQIREDDSLFSDITANSLSLGYTNDSAWMRFKLKNMKVDTFKGMIEYPIPWVDSMDLYIVKGHQVLRKSFGAKYKFYQREIPSRAFYIPLELYPAEEVTIFLNAKGEDSLTIAPYLYTMKLGEEKINYGETFNGIILGVLLIMIIYNLVIYLMLKDENYLYYVFYLMSALLFMGTIYGYNFELFWPDMPEFNQKTLSSTIAMFYFTGLIFSRKFLNTQSNLPRLDRLLVILMYIFFILIFLDFLIDAHQTVVYTTIFLISFYSVLILFASALSLQKKVPGSGFFLLSWASTIISSLAGSAMVQGYLDYYPKLYDFYGISIIIDVALLSFALTDRINTLRKEKELVQTQLIAKTKEVTLTLEKSKAELDAKVIMRTKELEESQKMLNELVNRDGMTNLYNRRFLYEIGEQLLNKAKQDKKPLGIIMFDIDKFKNINDTYGHGIGDKVIKYFASVLKNVEENYVAVSLGGEEFLLILPDTDKETVYNIAVKIRKKAEKHELKLNNGSSLYFTVSAGVDIFLLDKDDSIDHALLRIDSALYEAKKSGRNIVCMAE